LINYLNIIDEIEIEIEMKLNIKPLNDVVREMYNGHEHYNAGDIGLDLFFPEDTVIEAGKTVSVDLMIQCEAFGDGDTNERNVPYWLLPRSSISKTPLRMANSVGVIDAGYRGNLIVVVDNRSDQNYEIKRGQRLFQVCPWNGDRGVEMNIVDSLSNTERGNDGFGSTGV